MQKKSEKEMIKTNKTKIKLRDIQRIRKMYDFLTSKTDKFPLDMKIIHVTHSNKI